MDTVTGLVRQLCIDALKKYEEQIGVCLDRLTESQIWERENEHVNTVGNLMLHLSGSLGEFLVSAVGGAPNTRERDLEFNTSGGVSRAELRARLEARVAESIEIIGNLPDARLTELIVVRDKSVPVLSIVLKVVEHFALHTGQILLHTKQLTGRELGFTTHNRVAPR